MSAAKPPCFGGPPSVATDDSGSPVETGGAGDGDGARQPGKHRKRRRPGRLRRLAGHAQTLRREPRAAGPLLRASLLEIWRARGGGFYGLGYLVTFLILEARMVGSEFAESDSLATFLSSQLLEYVLRLGLLSLVNALQAFIWPALLFLVIGFWAVPVLVAGHLGFERWLRPRIESVFPELR